MIARLLLLAVLALALPVRAQITAAGPAAVQYGSSFVVGYATNGTPIASAARSITVASGEALIRDMFTVSGPAGSLPAIATRTATAAGVARALAVAAGRLSVPLTVGMLAYDILGGVGVRQGANGAEIDPGKDSLNETVTVYCYAGAGPSDGLICDPSRPNACKSSLATYSNNGAGFRARFIQVENGTGTCIGEATRPGQVNNDGTAYWSELRIGYQGSQSRQNTGCSSEIDQITGLSYIPGVRADGKCITGRYQAATEQQVETAILPQVQKSPQSLVDALKAAIAAASPVPATAPQVSGPASQVGQPRTTTTTGPAGQTATTTTPTYQYNYAGDTITYNTTNQTVTNVTNNGGTTTTETKTEPAPADTKQLCDLYPDSLACLKPGTAPDPEAIPIHKTPVTITPDRARWGANSGACTRAAIRLTSGPTINLWQPFCDFFALIHGVVVGTFGLVGAFLFKNGVK